jgi:hypothetical protein
VEGNIEGVSNAWKGLREALAQSGATVTILQGIAGALRFLTDVVNDHPMAATGLTALATALGLMAVAGGSAAVVAIGLTALAKPLGLLGEISGMTRAAAGMTAVGAAGTQLSGVRWGLIAAGLITLVTTIDGVWKQMQTMTANPGGWSSDSPFWRGVPESEQRKYPNSPANDPHANESGASRLWHWWRGDSSGPAAPPPTPPAPEGDKHSSIQGDVYLDGHKVGTWQGRALASLAGRPPAGPTGFDGRMTPAWPSLA